MGRRAKQLPMLRRGYFPAIDRISRLGGNGFVSISSFGRYRTSYVLQTSVPTYGGTTRNPGLIPYRPDVPASTY